VVRWAVALAPLVLLLASDWRRWNQHVPAAAPFLRLECVAPVLLLAALWSFRVVHWAGARLALWLYQQRYGLIFTRRPKRLILLRHGESVGNVDKAVYQTIPDHRLGLSAVGQEQALKAGDAIARLVGGGRVGVFVSPFLRTQQTCAHVLSRLNPDQVAWVRQDPRLREQEWGNFQRTRESAKILGERERVGRFYYRFPTGESGADVYDRVSSFFVALFRQFDGPVAPPETILIVSHGLMMRFFCMYYFRWSVDTFDTVWNPDNCDLWVLGKDNRGHYAFTTEGSIPRSTKPVTVVFRDGREETLLLRDCITAPVTDRRREDWILAQLGLDPADVREVILERDQKLVESTVDDDDDDYPIRKLLDAEESCCMRGGCAQKGCTTCSRLSRSDPM
jgi:broad specificity phosphatase PhoE